MSEKTSINRLLSSRVWLYTVTISLGIVLSVSFALIFGFNTKLFLAELLSSIISAPIFAEFLLFMKKGGNNENKKENQN